MVGISEAERVAPDTAEPAIERLFDGAADPVPEPEPEPADDEGSDDA